MRIYAGNLPPDVTTEELDILFAAFGMVGAVELTIDEITGKARDFAFIDMPKTREGKKAIAALNGLELRGKFLAVEAVPQPRRRRTDPEE